jgi:hypothetical protein
MITTDELLKEAGTTAHVKMMRKSINNNNAYKLNFDETYDLWFEALTRAVENMKGIKRPSRYTLKQVTKPPVFLTMNEALNYVRVTANNMYVQDISMKYHSTAITLEAYKQEQLLLAYNSEEIQRIEMSYAQAWDEIFSYLRRDNYKYYTYKECGIFKTYFDGGKIGKEGKNISYRSLAKEFEKSYFFIGQLINKMLADIRKEFGKKIEDIVFIK